MIRLTRAGAATASAGLGLLGFGLALGNLELILLSLFPLLAIGIVLA